jgi:hypothetical protein
MSTTDISAYLTRIGMPGQAGDIAWLKGAERIIIAEREATAKMLRDMGHDHAADAVLQGEQWR